MGLSVQDVADFLGTNRPPGPERQQATRRYARQLAELEAGRMKAGPASGLLAEAVFMVMQGAAEWVGLRAPHKGTELEGGE